MTGNVAGDSHAVPGTAMASHSGGRRRRPSGEPPPLPRHTAATTRWYLAAIIVTGCLEAAFAASAARSAVNGLDEHILSVLPSLRSGLLYQWASVVTGNGSANTVRIVGWFTIAVLLAFRRLRQLVVYLLVALSVVVGATSLTLLIGRMRPSAVTASADWQGYSHPAVPVTAAAAILIGAMYTLIPRGMWRNRAKWAAAVVVGLLCLLRMMLRVDHPTDALAALGLGWAAPVVLLRLLLPDDVFPVHYRAVPRAHLDVTGSRGEAIRKALEQQLGLRMLTVVPFAQAGSAGSTPLRLTVAHPDGSTELLFAKLYALNHLRADRSYKLSRMVLYGRLEDEKPFSTVRRLVEYEDHLLRLLRDAGLPTPQPYGFVEITPEREYLIVMSFFADAVELGSAPIGEAEIDSGLAIVRRLWQAGVAHRDIKPSNLLIRDGRVMLIDVAFATVRPTPWRQAVDLANMMLTLALSSDPALVYARAARLFSPDEIAEAFAATRSVTLPSQLRSRIRRDPRRLIVTFRSLAPPRPPVSIQLWSVRRVLLTMGLLCGAVLGVVLIYLAARTAGLS